MAYQPQTGSVIAFQSDPTKLVGTVSVVGALPIQGSVATVIIGGSILTTSTPNQSVSGTITANQGTGFGSVAAHIKSGSVVAVLGGNTSVVAIQGGVSMSSISGIGGMSTASSVYTVLSSITSVSLLSANVGRIGATIYNNSGTRLFTKLGTNATTSVFTVSMDNNDYYEVPYGWTGVVAGITASNAGTITITELT